MVSPTGRSERLFRSLFRKRDFDSGGISSGSSTMNAYRRAPIHAKVPAMLLDDDVPCQIQPEAGALPNGWW